MISRQNYSVYGFLLRLSGEVLEQQDYTTSFSRYYDALGIH